MTLTSSTGSCSTSLKWLVSPLSTYSLWLPPTSVPVWANTEPSPQNEWKTSFGRWPNTSGILLQSDRPITAFRRGCGSWGSPSGRHNVLSGPCTSITPLRLTNEIIIKQQRSVEWHGKVWKWVKGEKKYWNMKQVLCGGRVVASHHPFTTIGSDATNRWCLTENRQ